MSLLSELELGALRALRARLGAGAALVVALPIIGSREPSPERAQAIGFAIECAIEAGDEAAIENLALWWSLEPSASPEVIARACLALADKERMNSAAALADAEVLRKDSAIARWVRASVSERAGDERAAREDLETARSLAAPGSEIERAVCIEIARLLSRRPGGRVEAARLVAGLESMHGPAEGRARTAETRDVHGSAEGRARTAETRAGASSPRPDTRPRGAALPGERERLIIAIARTGDPGRYVRLRGLDELEELARSTENAIARAAIRAACEYLDEAGANATPLEAERVQQALSHWPEPGERASAEATLAALRSSLEGDAAERSAALVRAASSDEAGRVTLERARAVLSGDAPGPRPARETSAWCALSAIAAMRKGRDDEAAERLRELRAVGERGASAPVWTAALRALERPALRADASALVALLLRAADAPPRGFLDLASALERARDPELALAALARAHERREPGAKERRIEALVRAGWEAAREGRNDDAVRALSQARTIAAP